LEMKDVELYNTVQLVAT